MLRTGGTGSEGFLRETRPLGDSEVGFGCAPASRWGHLPLRYSGRRLKCGCKHCTSQASRRCNGQRRRHSCEPLLLPAPRVHTLSETSIRSYSIDCHPCNTDSDYSHLFGYLAAACQSSPSRWFHHLQAGCNCYVSVIRALLLLPDHIWKAHIVRPRQAVHVLSRGKSLSLREHMPTRCPRSAQHKRIRNYEARLVTAEACGAFSCRHHAAHGPSAVAPRKTKTAGVCSCRVLDIFGDCDAHVAATGVQCQTQAAAKKPAGWPVLLW